MGKKLAKLSREKSINGGLGRGRRPAFPRLTITFSDTVNGVKNGVQTAWSF
jgi:hypothetical protein